MGSPHRFIPNTEEDVAQMLQSIGVTSIDELFADIPASVRLARPLALPPAMSEPELMAELRRMSDECVSADDCTVPGRRDLRPLRSQRDTAHTAEGEFYTAYAVSG